MGLVITVNSQEKIRIGDNIDIKVQRSPKNIDRFEVHIEAPKDVVIKRGKYIDNWKDERKKP